MPNPNLIKIPKSIWALGFVSMFMDLSSELIHAILPLFMVTTLGASMTTVGVIEGFAESISLMVKIFSGTLSDYMGKRKFLAVIGYGLSALTKPLFPLANSITTVFIARFSDRIGKGIRGAPRDALVGDIAPPEIRGKCFGLRQTLDTVGAFAAPIAAMILMILFANDLRTVMWFATIPAIICVLTLIFGVKEPAIERPKKPSFPLKMENIRTLKKPFWTVVIAAMFLTMARFSDAFLLLKAQNVGMSMSYIPLIMVIMNLVYAFSAYPLGALSDKISREKLLVSGIIVLAVANIVLAAASSVYMVILGTAIWGLHMGITQGLLATMVTDKAPAEMRGTAYGIFNLFCGFAMLIGSIIAGILWDDLGAGATFLFGAIFSLLALPLFVRR